MKTVDNRDDPHSRTRARRVGAVSGAGILVVGLVAGGLVAATHYRLAFGLVAAGAGLHAAMRAPRRVTRILTRALGYWAAAAVAALAGWFGPWTPQPSSSGTAGSVFGLEQVGLIYVIFLAVYIAALCGTLFGAVLGRGVRRALRP